MIKKVLFRIVMKRTATQNMLSEPEKIHLPAKNLIGYKITTTLKDNKQKKDIPPFFHEVYDNKKLNCLNQGRELNMLCLFDMHENQETFDYYIAVENPGGINDEACDTLHLPKGDYLKVDFIKRNNKAVHMIMMYVRKIWMKANGFRERNAPAFILYDHRFHSNYEKYGCQGNDYPGNPVAALYLPVNK